MVLDIVTPTRVGIVGALLVAVLFGISLVGWDRFRKALTDRFVYGVPWGSLLVVVGVFAFYLFAQGGFDHWNSPVTLPFRNWAYPYATGMLSSGFAHNSPSHLLGNMLATIVFAPLAEFIWGHYPRDGRGTDSNTPGWTSTEEQVPASPAPAEFDGNRGEESIPSGPTTADQQRGQSSSPTGAVGDRVETPDTGGTSRQTGETRRVRDRPLVRALVIFPGVVVLVSLLTSLYALGWSLGFSGTVFAIFGFTLVKYPIPSAVAILGTSLLNTLLNTLLTPVLRATAESGPPQPPAWAGINVQAHILGFLVGVLVGLALLWVREERPEGPRLLLATVLVASVQGLWQLSTTSGDEFVRYQGIGVIFVLLLAVLVTYVTVGENVELSGWTGTLLRGFGVLWLAVVVLGVVASLALFEPTTMTVLTVTAVAAILLAPGVFLVVPGKVFEWPMSTRRVLFVGLIVITVVIALPSAVGNTLGIAEDAVPDGAVAVEDYHVSYAENVTHGRVDSTGSGVVVVSEQRYVWGVVVNADVLAHRGTATVPVGGIGWRGTVEAEREGWDVVGNDSVYAVDLETDDQRVRSFTSAPAKASIRIANNEITVVPTAEEFLLNVTQNGETVGSTPVPDPDRTATVGDLEFTTRERDGTTRIIVSTADARSIVAEKE